MRTVHTPSRRQQRAGDTRLRVIVALLILIAGGGLFYYSMPSSRVLRNCGCTVIEPPGPLLRPFFSWGREYNTIIDCSDLPVTTADIRAALQDFQSYPRLELQLRGSQITDDTISVLRDVQNVMDIDLSSTGVSDRGLRHLAALHHLKSLWIDESVLTDVGIRNIANIASLRRLSIMGTKIDRAKVERLLSLLGDLPQVNVYLVHLTISNRSRDRIELSEHCARMLHSTAMIGDVDEDE